MTIRNTTPATEEPDFFSAPISEYGVQTSSSYTTTSTHGPSAPSLTYYSPAVPVEPFSSATAITTGQSFRREDHDQLVTIPSSNVLIDTSSPPNTTTQTVPQFTRPVQVTPVDHPSDSSQAIIYSDSNSNSNSNSNNKYIRKYGMIINRKNAHLPEPVLRFKQTRKRRTVVAAWTGGAVGLVVAGPLGAAVGASAAYVSAKSVGKTRERKMEKKYDEQQLRATSTVALPVEQVIV